MSNDSDDNETLRRYVDADEAQNEELRARLRAQVSAACRRAGDAEVTE